MLISSWLPDLKAVVNLCGFFKALLLTLTLVFVINVCHILRDLHDTGTRPLVFHNASVLAHIQILDKMGEVLGFRSTVNTSSLDLTK